MTNDKLLSVWLNPLQFLEIDEPWAPAQVPPTEEDTLRFLCPANAPMHLADLFTRYRQISQEPRRLFAAPAEERILTKLVWPLRHAKGSYMVGNYLGTIALCGLVSEMVAMLLFEISNIRLNGQPLKAEDEIALFGSNFEKLGQDRRVKVLGAYHLIDDEVRGAFDKLRLIRRKYLHLWSQDHANLPEDAVSAYHAAVRLVVHVIGQDIRDGKLVLNPALTTYLEKRGTYTPPPDEESPRS